jgi:hypothetical protein
MRARNINTCYVWPIDCGPARDFPRSVSVCIIRVSTSHADKLRLAFPVSFIDATALATGTRGVPCVNELDRDTGSLSFIKDKALQLGKRPTVQTTALLFISPYPTAYAFEILKRDTAFGALSSTHYLFRNLVIHITRKPLFFSSAPAHQSLGGLRALLLKLPPQASIASPAIVDGGSSEAFAVRCFGNRHQSHVDANPLDRLVLFLIGHVNSRKEKPCFVSVNQICFSALKGQQFPMMVPAYEWNLLAAVKRPNVRAALVHLPRQDARIATDRAVLTKFTLRLLVNLVSVSTLEFSRTTTWADNGNSARIVR